MVQPNFKLIRTLQYIGFLFVLGAGAVLGANLLLDIDWDLTAGIFFLSFLMVGGLSFGIAGLISENPDKSRKFFSEWLLGITSILIWVIVVYSLL